MIKDTVNLKWLLKRIESLGLQMDSNVDKHGNRIYHIWPYEPDYENVFQNLVPSISFEDSRYRLTFVRMGDTDNVARNIRYNHVKIGIKAILNAMQLSAKEYLGINKLRKG